MTLRSSLLRCGTAFCLAYVAWGAHGAQIVSAATCLRVDPASSRCAQSSDQIPWEIPEVHAVVVVADARPGTLLKAVWICVDAIEPRNFVIQSEERKVATSGTETSFLFTIAKDEWPSGRYRLDLFLDGKAVQSLPFSVRKASAGGRTAGSAGTPVARWSPKEPAAAASSVAAAAPAPYSRPATAPSTPASASALPIPVTAPSLTGSWVTPGPFGPLTLEFPSPGTLVLAGQPYTYTLAPNALRVSEEGTLVDYPYTLREGVLTLLFPQGFSLTFQPAAPTQIPPAYGAVPYSGGAGIVPMVPGDAPGHGTDIPVRSDAQLSGRLCTASAPTGQGYSASLWSEYDGQGNFSFGMVSPYGATTAGGGTYRVQGNTIQFQFVDGTSGTAQVQIRQADGRITAMVYGQILYSTGFCQ